MTIQTQGINAISSINPDAVFLYQSLGVCLTCIPHPIDQSDHGCHDTPIAIVVQIKAAW